MSSPTPHPSTSPDNDAPELLRPSTTPPAPPNSRSSSPPPSTSVVPPVHHIAVMSPTPAMNSLKLIIPAPELLRSSTIPPVTPEVPDEHDDLHHHLAFIWPDPPLTPPPSPPHYQLHANSSVLHKQLPQGCSLGPDPEPEPEPEPVPDIFSPSACRDLLPSVHSSDSIGPDTPPRPDTPMPDDFDSLDTGISNTQLPTRCTLDPDPEPVPEPEPEPDLIFPIDIKITSLPISGLHSSLGPDPEPEPEPAPEPESPSPIHISHEFSGKAPDSPPSALPLAPLYEAHAAPFTPSSDPQPLPQPEPACPYPSPPQSPSHDSSEQLIYSCSRHGGYYGYRGCGEEEGYCHFELVGASSFDLVC